MPPPVVVVPQPEPEPQQVAVRRGALPTVPLMVRVLPELREELRGSASLVGVTMQDAVAEAVRDWCKKVRKRAGG